MLHRRLAVGLPLLYCALWCAGCGDGTPTADTGDPGDAAIADAPSVDVAAPMPPTAPSPPRTECPSGWERTDDEHCVPYASPPECDGDSALFVDGMGCTRVGAECPVGAFPDPPPTGAALYVDPTAPSGGDGSVDAPFTRIFSAVAAARTGTTILLSEGRHSGFADLPPGVNLEGACAERTFLVAPTPDSATAIVFVDGGEVTVRNLTITGPRIGVASVGASTVVRLEGVRIEDVSPAGMTILGGTIEAVGISVRDVTPASDVMTGRAAEIFVAGRLELRRSVIRRASAIAVLVSEASTALLEDVAIRETGFTAVRVQEGASLEARRTWIDDSASSALSLDGEVTADVEDLAITSAGRGIGASGPSTLMGSRLFVADGGDASLLASDGASLVVDDLRTSGGERALRAQQEGRIVVERAHMTGGSMDAVAAGEGGSSIVIRDATIADFGDDPMAHVGRGLSAYGGTVEAERVRIRDVRGSALLSAAGTGELTALDVDIEGVHAFLNGSEGVGLVASDGTMAVERVHVRGARLMGVYADLGSASLRDIAVDSIAWDPALAIGGRGISVGPGGEVTLERAAVSGAEAFGLFVGGLGASLEAAELTIVGAPCTTCPGVGLGVYRLANASVRGFLIDDNATIGVQVAFGAVLELADGVVSNNPVGVALDDPTYDVSRLMENVRYSNNDTNLDSAGLPVPDAADGDFSIEPPAEMP